MESQSKRIICPKCGFNQLVSYECVRCGVIFSKIKNLNNKRGKQKINEVKKEIPSENLNQAMKCIVKGKPIEVVDLLGNVLSLPSKVLLLSMKIDSHMITDDVVPPILEFISCHDLYDVKVRLNQFAPHDEFLRLFKNNNMNILIRIFFGIFFLLGYLLNPGRLFGGDFYNPTTNSVNIFSNHTGIALHELGHALDFKNRKYPGLYQLSRFIPFVALYQEYKASKYAL